MTNGKPILFVEADPDCADLVRRAFEDLGASNTLVHLIGCQHSLTHLLRSSGDKRPSLILLNPQTQGMSGSEFLRILKADKTLRTIPVVVLTKTPSRDDVTEYFGLGAAGYLTMRDDYQQILNTVRTIKEYWSLSELPHS